MTQQQINQLLTQIRKSRSIAAQQRRSYKSRSSKLLPLSGIIFELHRDGASLGDIQFFLKHLQNIHASRSTIKRFIDKKRASDKQREESLFS